MKPQEFLKPQITQRGGATTKKVGSKQYAVFFIATLVASLLTRLKSVRKILVFLARVILYKIRTQMNADL